MPNPITLQTGGVQWNGEGITDYALLIGGLNASNNALKKYTPLVTGFNRFFIVRPPWFVIDYFKNFEGGSSWYSKKSLWIQVKHLLEYCFLSITGFQDPTIETDALTGGYAGRALNIPTGRANHTTQITMTVPEFSGSPVRQVIRDIWMNGMVDEISGATHYQGKVAVDKYNNPAYIPAGEEVGTARRPGIGKPVNEAYHSMEAIYTQTDRSLANVENAIMCAHMYPINFTEQVDYPGGGQHELVTANITWNVVTYKSVPVTALADKLLKTYFISSNSLNMNPEEGAILDDNGNINLARQGAVPGERNVGTQLGNAPAYTYNSNFQPRRQGIYELQEGKRFDPPPDQELDNNVYSGLSMGRNDSAY